MNTKDITVLVLTYNEAPNITRCLERLLWAESVLIVDSGSSDGTRELAGQFSNVRILDRPFDDFAGQCNFGISRIDTPWTLSIDADYIMHVQFPDMLGCLDGRADGYSAGFRYVVSGRKLRCGLYPPRTVLYRTRSAAYEASGHGHRVVLPGKIERLPLEIEHDDRKPLSRWLDSQRSYAVREAEFLRSADAGSLGLTDRIRRVILLAAPLVLVYVLIWKRGLLDGWPGLFYAMQRAYAEVLLSIELLDRRLSDEAEKEESGVVFASGTAVEQKTGRWLTAATDRMESPV